VFRLLVRIGVEYVKIRLMRWIDGLSRSQRVVVVIALGLALGALGSYLVSLGSGFPRDFAAPDFSVGGGFAPIGGVPAWLRLIIWLVMIGVWALASVRVLRPSPDGASSEQTP
jgi:hypothetical protein